jgi:succinyl-diaminopimelate desuccinylase
VKEANDRAVAAALANVSRQRLAELCSDMVDIASPTGQERALAIHLAGEMRSIGIDSEVQEVEGDLVNAIGYLGAGRGEGRSGQSLLLYAPIDTVTTGDATVDLPWAGPELRDDMVPRAFRGGTNDDVVVGLGAQNPKGHGACVLMAAEALRRAEVGLSGELAIGFGGGGMPSNRRRSDLPDGHGRGCAAMVDYLRPDHAVIAKTGWAVSWEEVGLTWFTVEVRGSHTYVGSRHLLPYRNAIADAGQIVAGLERWFEQWAEDHRDGLVAPQGVVAAIEGGWPHMAAFTTAVCRFHVDLRLSPRTTPAEAARSFGAIIEQLAAEIGADVSWAQGVAIPGTTTDPDAEIIQTAIAAWEQIEGRSHEPIAGLSGATDANILRAHGVPTARIGLPKVGAHHFDQKVDFQFGMNAVDVADLERLTQHLIRVAIAVCGPTSGT